MSVNILYIVTTENETNMNTKINPRMHHIRFDDCLIIIFPDDTTFAGLISHGDEFHYRYNLSQERTSCRFPAGK
jgi:hypothetical protein